jgi:hypothetical protein
VGLGLIYKKGKFSAIEEEHLKRAIDNYQNVRCLILPFIPKHLTHTLQCKSLTPEDMEDIIFPKIEKNKDNAFWSEIS